MPSTTRPKRKPARSGRFSIRIHCEMPDCRAVTTLISDDVEPYTTFRRGAKDWLLMETEKGDIIFHCPRCSAPVREDIARREQEEAARLTRTHSSDDSEDDDSVTE